MNYFCVCKFYPCLVYLHPYLKLGGSHSHFFPHLISYCQHVFMCLGFNEHFKPKVPECFLMVNSELVSSSCCCRCQLHLFPDSGIPGAYFSKVYPDRNSWEVRSDPLCPTLAWESLAINSTNSSETGGPEGKTWKLCLVLVFKVVTYQRLVLVVLEKTVPDTRSNISCPNFWLFSELLLSIFTKNTEWWNFKSHSPLHL